MKDLLWITSEEIKPLRERERELNVAKIGEAHWGVVMNKDFRGRISYLK